jgi:hypothetical protein
MQPNHRRILANRTKSTVAVGNNKKGHKAGGLVPRLKCDPWCQRTSPNPLDGVTGIADL